MDGLKRCPFCGGEAVISTGTAWHWVRCKRCKAETRGCRTKWQAEEAWNRRVDHGEIDFDYEAEDC